jgi:hypothetical protein
VARVARKYPLIIDRALTLLVFIKDIERKKCGITGMRRTSSTARPS